MRDARLAPRAFPLAVPGHLSALETVRPEEKALHLAKMSLQCDTSKNRQNTVNINNQTKM